MADADLAAEDLALDPWVGHVLSGRYRLVAAIGAGGMGVVYRAWDLATDGYVVVKMPKRELLGEPKFLQRFEQELSALRSISHPAVVPIADVGNEQGTPFAVMPYLAGGSLKQRRLFRQDRQAAPEPPANLWRWLPAIAKALDFVHANGYVHRDVKPDNILFDGPGKPFLSDFGVAKIVLQSEDETASRGLTGTGLALGTPAYMAPELISGTKPSPRIDQYALAVTVYELLAARKPFDGPTPAAVILAHVTGNAPALASLLPSLPPHLSDAVARGMAREPADRFENCAEFASAALAAVTQPSAAEKLQLMCPQCSRLLNVKPDWAGKQGNCPRCKSAMSIGSDLTSLWLQGDRLGTIPAGETVPVRILGPTPSQPMAIPKPPSGPMPTPRTRASFTTLTKPFAGYPLVRAAAAATAGLALIAITIAFYVGEPLHDQDAAIADVAKPQVVTSSPKPKPAAEALPRAALEPLQSAPAVMREEEEEEVVGLQETQRAHSRPWRGTQQEQPPEPAEENAPVTSEASPAPTQQTTVAAATPPARDDARAGGSTRATARERLPAPPDDEVSKVIATFREAYENEYAAAKANGKYSALTGRLERVISETQDPTQRFALLVEAEELSLTARNLGRAMGYLDTRIQTFDLESSPLRLTLLKKFSTSKKIQPSQELLDDSLGVASQAADRDDYEVAHAACQLAITTAKALERIERAVSARQRTGRGTATSPAGPSQVKGATEFLNAVRTQKKIFEAYKAAQEQIASDPGNEQANAAIGRYLCFTKGDWGKGLPCLAKGQDDAVRQVAERELSLGDRSDSTASFEVAGAWWDLAASKPEGLTTLELAAIKDHACRSYAAMARTISDPTNRALAEKRGTDFRDLSSFAARLHSDNEGQRRGRGKKGDSPVFTIVPEPRGLSEELYSLLPTAEEIESIGNHLTLDDNQVYQARRGFPRRLERSFPAEKWTDVDVKFIIAWEDIVHVKLGESESSREWSCARIASMWLLGSPDELEFVRRARTIPQNILDDLNSYVTMSRVKDWLLARGALFPTDNDKAAALDRILQAGFQFRGITEFRAALGQQLQQQ